MPDSNCSFPVNCDSNHCYYHMYLLSFFRGSASCIVVLIEMRGIYDLYSSS